MKVKIDIDTRTFIRFGLVVLGFVLGLVVIYRASYALTIVAVSIFLSLALNPPVSRISRLLPGKSRVSATALAYLLVIAALGGLLFTVVPPIVSQTAKFAQTVPDLIDQVAQSGGVVNQFTDRYGLQDPLEKSLEGLKSQASSFAANLGNILVDGAASVFSGLATLIFILVLTFLMLIEGPGWMERLWGMYSDPVRLDRHREVVHRMYRVVTGYVNGQLLVASIAALCTLATVFILSTIFPLLPPNLAFAAAAIVFATGLVPMIGATIGAVLVGAILVLNDAGAAFSFIVYFIIYQQIENNFIAPTIQSRHVELSALTVLVAILVGTSLFGVLGGILAIPIAGCIRVLTQYYINRSTELRKSKQRKLLPKLAKKSAH